MGFITPPKIGLIPGGMYELLENVCYYSPALKREFQMTKYFKFSPSIPTVCRVLVPVTSDIVAASLPHDWLYEKQPEWVTQAQADLVGKEVLVCRNVDKHIIYRFYYALRSFGWYSWRKNKLTLKRRSPE